MSPAQVKGLEVHEHCFVSGPRASIFGRYKFSHSHAGGEVPHQHPQTGPACYTIDKDEWRRRTGLVGGGRKQFTESPTGEQLPIVTLEDWQREFEVIVDESAARFAEENKVTGAGVEPALRMVLAFGMKAVAS